MAASDAVLINEIREIKRRLDRIEKALFQLLVEKEESELISEGV
jgi:hypothetical protein